MQTQVLEFHHCAIAEELLTARHQLLSFHIPNSAEIRNPPAPPSALGDSRFKAPRVAEQLDLTYPELSLVQLGLVMVPVHFLHYFITQYR